MPKIEIQMGQPAKRSTCGVRQPNDVMLGLMRSAMDEDRAADMEEDGELSMLARQVQIQLPGDDRPTVLMTSVNSGFWPLTLNFLCSWERVPTLDARKILYFAADQTSARQLRERGLVVLLASHAPESSKDADFGTLPYLLLNTVRTHLVRQLLALGYNVFQIDLDQVWLADPFPLISTHIKPGIDLISQPEADGRPCGGLMLLRNTEAMRRAWDQTVVWLERHMVDYALADCIADMNVGDQTGILQQVRAKKVTVALLPSDLFPWGSLFFDGKTTKLQDPRQTRPMIVHNNYIIGMNSKIIRFKSYGLWLTKESKGTDGVCAP
jgi:hypothetical protein